MIVSDKICKGQNDAFVRNIEAQKCGTIYNKDFLADCNNMLNIFLHNGGIRTTKQEE